MLTDVFSAVHTVLSTLVSWHQAIPFSLEIASAAVVSVLLLSCDLLGTLQPGSPWVRWLTFASRPALVAFVFVIVIRFAAIFNLG